MRVVILAGGLGTRISEESAFRPKPMVEIGGMPILWHIMKGYYAQGFDDFVICAGYKQHVIKEWFANYYLNKSDVTFDFSSGEREVIRKANLETWRVTVVDAGLHTQTGGRIKRIADLVGDETFLLTYGDGVGDVDVNAVLAQHRANGRIATVSAYNFGESKGVLDMGPGGEVADFREKSDLDGDLINIGFMALEPGVFDYIEGDGTAFEREPMRQLARDGQLDAYVHKGFWQCMDTQRERLGLEQLWESGAAPWKTWED